MDSSINNQIHYIEFKSTNIEETKTFYAACFGWTFMDYGPEYASFEHAGIAGGFAYSSETITNGVLVVLYHQDLTQVKQRILDSGGRICKDIFSFPGGKRFHFLDPSGNELAVWSE